MKNFHEHDQVFQQHWIIINSTTKESVLNQKHLHQIRPPFPNTFSDDLKQEVINFSPTILNNEAIILWINKSFFFNLLYPEHSTFIYYNWKYYLCHPITNNEIKALDISVFILSQRELAQILISWDLIFLVIIFITSMYFTEKWLKKLKNLADYAENLNINNLSLPVEIEEKAADNDEIKLISNALNTSLQRINSQVSSLREFISNASHELKTPLMMMNTEIDVALKKKDYENHLKNLKISTKRMADLVDSLSLITRIESNTNLEKKPTQILPICENTINQILKIYPHSNIQIKANDKTIEKEIHEWLFSIIIKNLVENACKYAWNDAKIELELNKDSCIISDNGKWISESDLEHLFERFRQEEKDEQWKQWFGLWLYLVKRIVDLHGRTLNVESEIWKWTTFTIKR